MNHPITPKGSPFKRFYVLVMMNIVGRGLQAITKVDKTASAEISELPAGTVFEMTVEGRGPGFSLRKTGHGWMQYLGINQTSEADLSIRFKHINHAFLVLSFQESTPVAFSHDRMVVHGEIAYVMKMVRVLNRMQATILPKFIAERAIKRYPVNLGFVSKIKSAVVIYTRMLLDLFRKNKYV